jgi:hypothetical protein
MDLSSYLLKEAALHPLEQAQDVYKHLYQASFGPEHLLTDPDAVARYLHEEWETVAPAKKEALYDEISPSLVRVNIARYKAQGYQEATLLRMFLGAQEGIKDSEMVLAEGLETATSLIIAKKLPVSLEDWERFMRLLKAMPLGPVHHSEFYREHYDPHYRLALKKNFLVLFPAPKKE